jgi:Flp pilus assembly protein TadG
VIRTGRARGQAPRGQALVEFALALIPFLLLLLAIFDFGRAIYIYNGVSQAAREVARTASVKPNQNLNPVGYSLDAQDTVATQSALVPGLVVDEPVCVASAAASTSSAHAQPCALNEFVVVTAHSTYTPVSLLGFLGTIQISATARVQMPLSQHR